MPLKTDCGHDAWFEKESEHVGWGYNVTLQCRVCGAQEKWRVGGLGHEQPNERM